jgi:S1-C subfamily serine protease
MRRFAITLFMFLGGVSIAQEKPSQPPVQEKVHKDVQELVLDITPTASDAVIPITYWVDHNAPGQQALPVAAGVVGTGFLVNDKGDFITAAHVAGISEIGPAERRIKVRLTATIRQRSGDGSGFPFNVVEVDQGHDLALCHIDGFRVYRLGDSPAAKTQAQHLSEKGALTVKDASRPFASLAISKNAPQAGHFVLVSGFPLGSWTPTIQFGLVSAVQNIYPRETPIGGVPKDSRQLLQVSVNANHGNSGGPVIDLSSGEVVGVILQIVPAPLALNGNVWNSNTYDMSGIMLAAPASWIENLLARHNVKSHALRAGKRVIG